MSALNHVSEFEIRPVGEDDIPLVLSFIRQIAEYEHLSHEVIATEESLRESFFGERRFVEGILGYYRGKPVSYAIYFHNFSTFLGRYGLYLEDIFVKPEFRGKGIGQTMLVYLAKLARERHCGRFEWAVLNWNESAIRFYKNLGAVPLEEWKVFRLSGEALDRLAEEK